MLQTVLLLCSLWTVISAAPRYGDNGGYLGYAAYKPVALANTLIARRQGPVDDYDDLREDIPHKSYHDPLRQPIRPEHKEEYPVPKKYRAVKYTPRYAYGYADNDVDVSAPYSSYNQVAHYGNGNGGYKMADVYASDYTGSPAKENDYDHDIQPYEYGYHVKDKDGNEQFKKEMSNGQGEVKGSYGFRDERGLYRQVEYVADKSGFRANVKTNEPGTDNQDPADVRIDSEEGKY